MARTPPRSDCPSPSLFAPNVETISAIGEARRGELTYVASMEELRDQMNRDIPGDIT